MRKRIHVRTEHVRRSRCNEAFLARVKANDAAKAEAKKRGETIKCKREAIGARPATVVKKGMCETQVFTPLFFDANHF